MICLEVNTQPGMTSTSLVPELAAYGGRSFGEYVRKHLQEQPVPPHETAHGAALDPRIEGTSVPVPKGVGPLNGRVVLSQ